VRGLTPHAAGRRLACFVRPLAKVSDTHPIGRVLVNSLRAVVGVAVFGIALIWDTRFVDSSFYPRVLKIVETTTPAEREHLLRRWAGTVGPFEGHISPWGLHPILRELGYCTNLWSYPGCKPLPSGDEGEGIAKDELLILSAQYRAR
jgi:hypothetical protein